MNVNSNQKSNKKKIPNKEVILKTAYGLFLKKGYQSVSIKDIMEASNLSKGGIYHHFESKEGILFEVLNQYFFKALDIDKSIFDGITFKQRIKKVYRLGVSLFEMVESMGKSGVKYPINSLYLFQLECESFPQIRKQFKATSMAYRALIENLVIEGIQNKEVKKELNPEVISYQIIGMIEGIAIHQSTAKDNVGPMLLQNYESVFESYFKFICLDS
ncbi:TetR/AcrR family transcriptional regulator [Hwangdonia lutea]|uniref:TetR/AcrR family transcriptional regulator n=1 Tax=Hwangdonia lutea TaxID=3075823 RepID=A0AA97EM15_9FLAO|nr:TetR/AcrR family transcriptional regulator [Hwangdonia sp. SCSIO 19198]WOD43874.1 TetR/AcrR family transcriptional regulator [Hwangdonia sp. SCSIO 19198]